MYFYLSLGTNIQPEQNAAAMTKALCRHFGKVLVFPFVASKPIGMDSTNDFLNSLAVIHTVETQENVKQILNSIETELGRDRTDPERSHKDRVADIDILGFSKSLDRDFYHTRKEPYIQQTLDPNSPKAMLSDYGLPSALSILTPEGPTTIYLDGTTGDIRIIEDSNDCFEDGVEATLGRD